MLLLETLRAGYCSSRFYGSSFYIKIYNGWLYFSAIPDPPESNMHFKSQCAVALQVENNEKMECSAEAIATSLFEDDFRV